MRIETAFFKIIIIFVGLQSVTCQLKEHFKYYEIIKQNHFKHQIRKRAANIELGKTSLDIRFKNRTYKFELELDNSIFSPNFKIFSIDEKDIANEVKDLELKLFHGHVYGYEKSKVSAIFEKEEKLGGFVMKIPQGTLAGESLSSYVRNAENSDDIIIYSEEDIKLSKGRRIQKIDFEDNLRDALRSAKVSKRSSSGECPRQNRACNLYLAADYNFFNEIGGRRSDITLKTMVSIIDQVNEIFKNTAFNECGRNFGLQIGHIHIYQNYSDDKNHFNSNVNNWNSKTFLHMFGFSSNLSNYCLGHLFTAKSMDSNVLGLANIASPKEDGGGICSTKANTGFTTFKDSFSRRLPSLQAMLVVAHEIGHSFGSHHDSDENSSCVPSTYPGYYLMYPHPQSGTEPNNKVFSECSIREITSIIKEKPSCFIAYNSSLCGNYKVESDEECDDGPISKRCCSKCRLINRSQCSDVNHECCKNCQYASNTTKCQKETTCHHEVYCSGSNATCDEPTPKNDNASCEKSSGSEGRCYGGKCISLCQFEKKINCICQGENMCKMCCKDKIAVNSSCRPYHTTYNLPDGTACAVGTCIKGKCNKSEASLVQRLWPMIEIKNISTLVIFTKNNIVGIILVVTLMVWIPASCAVAHLDQKNMKRELLAVRWILNSKEKFLQTGSKITMRDSRDIH